MGKINNFVIPCIATFSGCYKSNRKMTPKGIVLHSTGCNQPYLWRYAKNKELFGKNPNKNYFGTEKANGTIPHLCIGLDINKEVKCAQLLPFDICCWGCGRGEKGSYNYDPAYIQIEMCEDELDNPAYFKKVIELASDVCAALCVDFDIEIPRIVSHKEAHAQGYASNHGDPENWFAFQNYSMTQFRKDVQKKIGRKTIYRVQVGAFTSLENAENYQKKLTKDGYANFIVEEIL